IYKGAAMEGSEIDYRRASPVLLWRKRIGWLLILFVTESLTANVISHYDRLVALVPALAIYFPTLIGTGGNTGSQSATLVVRAIATGQIRGRDTLRVLYKELGAGVLIGVTIGVIAFLRIVLFRRNQGVGLAITAALAMTLIAIFANIAGALLPLLFKRLKVDPALTSSPFLATVMDAAGLLIYFNAAILVMHL
ncbi:MAG: magnesium transporter, partial [Deinococcus sp.]